MIVEDCVKRNREMMIRVCVCLVCVCLVCVCVLRVKSERKR